MRSQSNPSRPNSSLPAADFPGDSGTTSTLGLPGTAASTLAQTPRLEFTPLSTVQLQQKAFSALPSQPQYEEKKPPKNLQRPRRSTPFSSSTSHLPPPITQAPAPLPQIPIQPNGRQAPPPTRPPRNPARTLTDPHSLHGRPSSSSGRDYKALWDPTQQTGPLLSKFVRRHKSISAYVNGTVNGNGRSDNTAPAPLAGREEREKDKGRGRKEDTSPVSVRKQGGDTIGAQPSTVDHSNSLASDSFDRASSKSNSKSTQPSSSLRATQPLSLSPAHPLQEPLTQRGTHAIHASSREFSSSTITSTSPAKDKGKEKAGPNFSTLDRTILEELKLTLTARESQFVNKGQGSGGGMGIGAMSRKGERHHPYPKQEVPYPRSYERGVVDL